MAVQTCFAYEARWTGWPPSWAWTRSSCACATPWTPAPAGLPHRPSRRGRRPGGRAAAAAPGHAAARGPPAGALDPRGAARRGLERDPREGVRRGVGYAVGFKNIGYSEGFDDYSTARVRLSVVAGEPLVEVHTAAAEVGQGLVTLQAQIARTELGVERVVVLPADTQAGSAGSSSASRRAG